MFPLSVFLIAWFILLAIFGLMALLSVIQMLRYGLAGPGTYMTTLIFFVATFVVVFGTSAYLLTVDWTQQIDLFGGLSQSVIFNP